LVRFFSNEKMNMTIGKDKDEVMKEDVKKCSTQLSELCITTE